MYSAAAYLANRNDALGDKSFPVFLASIGIAFVIVSVKALVRHLRRPADTSRQTAELHQLLRDSAAFVERWPREWLPYAPANELRTEVDRSARAIQLWQYLRSAPNANIGFIDSQIAICQGRLATVQATMSAAARRDYPPQSQA
ncbi:hypothetical protein [Mycobacterium branderi]|uniref:Uncharacterized protein n=1 Tax=Mycobacterium branderi TaxID=43348 RepID=A0A7I7WDD2_9MYCO|nr:hypothetical protein [Mycobacterium branderi]MCV7236242.1 hypothetical protein [Mycobacterium branderi]ORA35423.1 hypothetical protein BST20_17655 [Mycobacterium branderi]BBZ15120.1 hypothetical protein MBRA_53150 [Mycobacterium branderi]